MRLGFVLGFLVGGGIASFVARSHEERAQVLDEAASVTNDAADTAADKVNPVVGRVKHQVEEAREAAREAQLEKEAEMKLLYESMVHRSRPSE